MNNNGLIITIGLISKPMISQSRIQTIAIHNLSNITHITKDNQTMKFGQFTEHEKHFS